MKLKTCSRCEQKFVDDEDPPHSVCKRCSKQGGNMKTLICCSCHKACAAILELKDNVKVDTSNLTVHCIDCYDAMLKASKG